MQGIEIALVAYLGAFLAYKKGKRSLGDTLMFFAIVATGYMLGKAF